MCDTVACHAAPFPTLPKRSVPVQSRSQICLLCTTPDVVDKQCRLTARLSDARCCADTSGTTAEDEDLPCHTAAESSRDARNAAIFVPRRLRAPLPGQQRRKAVAALPASPALPPRHRLCTVPPEPQTQTARCNGRSTKRLRTCPATIRVL